MDGRTCHPEGGGHGVPDVLRLHPGAGALRHVILAATCPMGQEPCSGARGVNTPPSKATKGEGIAFLVGSQSLRRPIPDRGPSLGWITPLILISVSRWCSSVLPGVNTLSTPCGNSLSSCAAVAYDDFEGAVDGVDGETGCTHGRKRLLPLYPSPPRPAGNPSQVPFSPYEGTFLASTPSTVATPPFSLSLSSSISIRERERYNATRPGFNRSLKC